MTKCLEGGKYAIKDPNAATRRGLAIEAGRVCPYTTQTDRTPRVTNVNGMGAMLTQMQVASAQAAVDSRVQKA